MSTLVDAEYDTPGVSFRAFPEHVLSRVAEFVGYDVEQVELYPIDFLYELDLESALVHGETYHLYVYTCDAYANCGMHKSAPILVDLTPPVIPKTMSILSNACAGAVTRDCTSAKVNVRGTADVANVAFWTSADEVQLAWNEGTYVAYVSSTGDPNDESKYPVILRNPVADPESPLVVCSWRVFRYYGSYDMDDQHHPLSEESYDVGPLAYAELHLAGLELGQSYVVQIHARNEAGSTSHIFSRPIVLDYTPPQCAVPALLPVSGDPMDTILPPRPGGTFYASLTWVGAHIRGVRMHLDRWVCMDAESAIRRVDVGVGLRPGAVCTVRDLWEHSWRGNATGRVSATVPSHDVVAFKLTPIIVE